MAEELYGFLTVDNAVVVAEGEIHHGTDLHFTIYGNGPLFDGVHTKDGDLGRIDDGGGKQAAEYTAVGDGECAALEIFQGDAPGFGFLGQIAQGAFDFSKRKFVGVADNRHGQTALGAHGYTDVDVVMVDDVVFIDGGVDEGKPLESVGGRLDEKAHEPELDAVALEECRAVFFAHGHDG